MREPLTACSISGMKITICALLLFFAGPGAAQNETGSAGPELESVQKVRDGLIKVKAALEVIEAMPDSPEKKILREGLDAAFQTMAILGEITGNSSSAPVASIKVGDKIPEITLRDGTVYRDVVVKSFTPGAALLSHEKGMVRVQLSRMDDQWRAKFGFDAALAEESERLEADKQNSLLRLPVASTVQPEDSRPANPENGINLYGLNAQEIDHNSDVYTKVAWKVTVYNHGQKSVSGVMLRFVFVDGNDFELEEEVEYPLDFAAGETRVISGQGLMLRTVWEKVEGYKVRTQ